MLRTTRTATILAAGLFITTPAHADDVASCLAATESGQAARNAGRLREAREEFVRCAGAACPAVVKQSCTRWLEEVKDALPTIVVRVREGERDIADGRVFVDGALRASTLTGQPIDVDPGHRTLRVEIEGRAPVARPLVLASGEKLRTIVIDLPTSPP